MQTRMSWWWAGETLPPYAELLEPRGRDAYGTEHPRQELCKG
jgi:hypothetical protein